MSRSYTPVRLLALSGAFALAAACGRSDVGGAKPAAEPAQSGATAQNAPPGAEKYPEPRWPSYFKPAKSVEDLLPAARTLVRNTSGFQGKGMGILNSGESVMIVVSGTQSDPMVLEAIKRALEERKITPHFKFSYELLGQTRAETEARRKANQKGRRIEDAGIYQATGWINGQFINPEEPKKWLRERRPDIFAELYPAEAAGPVPTSGQAGQAGHTAHGAEKGKQAPAGEDAETGMPREDPREGNKLGDAIKAYLKAHPEIKGVFWGGGGTTGLRRALYPMQDKYLGTFIQDNVYNLQSQMSSYPGDVWQLAEEQLLEPLAYVDRVEIKDPEGTDLHADLTQDMAERWSQGAYQRGHLYMFPNQATGRFGYSFVNYPGFQQKWLPREPIARIEGVMAGTNGHGGFFPRWEVYFKNGFISDVKGGGAHGAALKEFLQYPGLNDRVYPFHKTPGYWYLYEIAFGSHPKGFRHPMPLKETGNTSPERARSGVIHWGLGIRLWHDPDAPTESKTWQEFTEKNNLPKDHGFHTHTYFTTYTVRLRNANKTVNLLDKGRMTSLDDPEVRALASRYGDPAYILAEDWIPEVPGINAPGDYMKDYAPNPGKAAFQIMDKALAGTYEHYYPPAGTRMTSPEAAPAGTKSSGGGK